MNTPRVPSIQRPASWASTTPTTRCSCSSRTKGMCTGVSLAAQEQSTRCAATSAASTESSPDSSGFPDPTGKNSFLSTSTDGWRIRTVNPSMDTHSTSDRQLHHRGAPQGAPLHFIELSTKNY